MCCFQYDEDTSSKAIHNYERPGKMGGCVVFNMTKIQVRKQFTTRSTTVYHFRELFSIWRRYKFESNSQPYSSLSTFPASCFQYDEDTSSKAIHNGSRVDLGRYGVVFNMTKIQVRKQFTTGVLSVNQPCSCFQYDEDTSSKAIHNGDLRLCIAPTVVFNMTKIQVRKQFTTICLRIRLIFWLFSIWRRYKFESNSQRFALAWFICVVVFNMTKIQVRKQFTTARCMHSALPWLFSIWRRYKFESNSQHSAIFSCFFQVVFNMTKIQVRKQFTTQKSRDTITW